MHLLLIEDDRVAANTLKKGLTESGHRVDSAEDGDDGLHMALTGHYDALIVDRLLPKRDGLSIIRLLRADENNTPVLILSALGEIDDRVQGLQAGSDDYLVKPYAFRELLARLEAVVRRQEPVFEQQCLTIPDLEVDLQKQTVQRAGQPIRLQPKEFRLLVYLLQHRDQVVTRTMLLEQVWDFHFDPQTNVIDVQISRLRSKIDREAAIPLLHTIRGVGYKLSEVA